MDEEAFKKMLGIEDDHVCDPVEKVTRDFAEFTVNVHEQELKALFEVNNLKLPEKPGEINDYLEAKGYMLTKDQEDGVYTYTLGKVVERRKYKITAKFNMEGLTE